MTKYGQMAQRGHRLTWIICDNDWGLVLDDHIEKSCVLGDVSVLIPAIRYCRVIQPTGLAHAFLRLSFLESIYLSAVQNLPYYVLLYYIAALARGSLPRSSVGRLVRKLEPILLIICVLSAFLIVIYRNRAR